MITNQAVGSPLCHTRYTTTSAPPPALKAILAVLHARTKKGQSFKEAKEIRGIVISCDRGTYGSRGIADDVVRFLKNVGLLFTVGERTYFDASRQEEVLDACKNSRLPSPVQGTPGERLQAIQAGLAAKGVEEAPPSGEVPSDPTELVLEGRPLGATGLEGLSDDDLASYFCSLEEAKLAVQQELAYIEAESTRRAENARRKKLQADLDELRALRELELAEIARKQAELQTTVAQIAELEAQLTS